MKLSTVPHLQYHAPQRAAEGQGSSLRALGRGLDRGSELFRWVEMDEAASVFLGANHDAVQVLGVMDGLVSVYDGSLMLREGRAANDRVKVAGGAARIALGLGGAMPGLPGAISEGLLGGYQIIEGHHTGDRSTLVTGYTQLGVSVGMGMLTQGVGGMLGPALILASNAARVGIFTHDRLAQSRAAKEGLAQG